MMPLRVLALAVVLSLMGNASGWQDKDKPEKPKEPKKESKKERLKGFLPMNFKKLGLTDAQVQSIYKIQADYKDKLGELQEKMDKLKKERGEKIDSVLTAEQTKRLKEIRSGDKK